MLVILYSSPMGFFPDIIFCFSGSSFGSVLRIDELKVYFFFKFLFAFD